MLSAGSAFSFRAWESFGSRYSSSSDLQCALCPSWIDMLFQSKRQAGIKVMVSFDSLLLYWFQDETSMILKNRASYCSFLFETTFRWRGISPVVTTWGRVDRESEGWICNSISEYHRISSNLGKYSREMLTLSPRLKAVNLSSATLALYPEEQSPSSCLGPVDYFSLPVETPALSLTL